MKKRVHRRRRNWRGQAEYDLLSYFSDTILFEYDCRSRLLTFTPNIASRFSSCSAEAFDLFDSQQQPAVIHPDDLAAFQKKIHTAETYAEDQFQTMTIRFIDRDGEYRWMLCQLRRVFHKEQGRLMVVGKLSDIQEQRSKEEQLIERASIDDMTGVFNRKAVENQVSVKLGKTEQGFFFMMDVDNFKMINDTLGHTAGDTALKYFTDEIRRTFRKEDIFGRVGGDEFIVFMADTNSLTAARQKAGELLARLEKWENYVLSASIGIAVYPADGHTYEELYEAADMAMYQVKQKGKKGYSFYREP